jgi:predicted phosphodiesterase
MKVVAIPDLHLPWVKLDCLKEIYKIIRHEKPTHIVQLGDLYDQYMFSRYDKDFNVISPKEEIEYSREMSKAFWANIHRIGKYKCIQLVGNHDVRFAKRIMQCLPSLAHEIRGLREKYYKFEGVSTYSSDREYIEIDGVIYCHGWLSGITGHKRYFRQSVVHGHSHKPDLHYDQLSKSDFKPLWELDCGCLADSKAVPFDYTNSIMTNWKPAVGIIHNSSPELILL